MLGLVVFTAIGLVCGVDAYTNKLCANQPVSGVFCERKERPTKDTEKKKKMLNVTFRANPRTKLRN